MNIKIALQHSFIKRALSYHIEPLTACIYISYVVSSQKQTRASIPRLRLELMSMLQQQDRVEIDRWCY